MWQDFFTVRLSYFAMHILNFKYAIKILCQYLHVKKFHFFKNFKNLIKKVLSICITIMKKPHSKKMLPLLIIKNTVLNVK